MKIAMKTSFLSPNLSLYLDGLRIAGVIFLIVAYAQALFNIDLPLGQLRIGNEVFVFFLIASGFLNQYQAQYLGPSLRSYVIEKTSRVYSVVIICFLFCLLCDGIGKNTNPALYQSLEHHGLFKPYDAISIVSHFSFTSHIWFRNAMTGTMSSYWALSYIVMFYLYHSLTAFNAQSKNLWLIVWVLLVGPIVALYLVFWALGGATYDFVQKNKGMLSPAVAVCTYIFSLLAFVGGVVFAAPLVHAPHSLAATADANIMAYLYQLALGIIFALNILSFDALFGSDQSEAEAAPSLIRQSFRWASGGMLTIFVIYPSLLSVIRAVFAQGPNNLLLAVSGIIATLVIGYLLAELGERSREPYKGFVEGVLR
jgi:hypothetical protein